VPEGRLTTRLLGDAPRSIYVCACCCTHTGDADTIIAKARSVTRSVTRRGAAPRGRREVTFRQPADKCRPRRRDAATPPRRPQTFTGRDGRAFLMSQLCVASRTRAVSTLPPARNLQPR
jgi:hypothetical protein